MEKLVIDHSYALGIAWDKSTYRNHGILYQTPPGTGYFKSSLSFAPGRTAPGSIVVVPPSSSLAEIGAVKVRCLIFANPLEPPPPAPPPGGGGSARRQNIVEGHLSFAFFINSDLSLQGTFLDSTGNWVGIRSPASAIVPDRWVQLEFFYDGISDAKIFVGNTCVSSSYNSANLIGPPMLGSVRGIGPRGVAIGHWPEPDDRYTLAGYIRDVQVYKRDPLGPLKMIDPCCLRNLQYFHRLGHRLRTKGYDLKYAYGIRDRLIAEGEKLIAAWRGGTDQGTQELDALMRQFLYALARSGSVPLGPSLEPLLLWIAQRADPQQLHDVSNRMASLIKELPLNEEELKEITEKLCFSRLKNALDDFAKKFERDPRWQRLQEKHHQ